MKNFILALACLSLVVCSCKKENEPKPEEFGTLTLNVDVNIEVFDLQRNLKSADAELNDLYVNIYNSEDELIVTYDSLTEVPAEIPLLVGDYYVIAAYGDEYQVGFDLPYIYGRTDFSITAGGDETVTVECSIVNCAVSVSYSEDIQNSFTTYSTEVLCSEGSITFSETETRYGYFPLLPLTITATLTNSTQTKTLNGAIESPEAGKLYIVNLDAVSDSGQIAIEISLDETLEEEVINISSSEDNIWEGALLITEIFFEPITLGSTAGEYFEIYNATDSILPLDGFKIKDISSQHEISTVIELNPGGYCLMARTPSLWTDYSNTENVYEYSSVSLNNGDEELSIYSPSDDLVFSIEYDGDDYTTSLEDQSLQFNGQDIVYDSVTDITNWVYSDSLSPGYAND